VVAVPFPRHLQGIIHLAHHGRDRQWDTKRMARLQRQSQIFEMEPNHKTRIEVPLQHRRGTYFQHTAAGEPRPDRLDHRGGINPGGEMVLMSAMILPGRAPSKTPCGPRMTWSTSGESGRQVRMTSECSATSRED